MAHAARRGERTLNAEPPGRATDPEPAPAIRSSAGAPKPELRLLVVGGRRIDVAAIGNFDDAYCDALASRLDRLVAGGPGCLHVDCSRIVSIDRSVAELFAGVREQLRSRGGTLELVDAPSELLSAMNETATSDAAAAPESSPAAAS
jgi:anti-anti-sigma regulatory factor